MRGKRINFENVIRFYAHLSIIINLPNQNIKTQNRYKPTNLENNYKNSRNQKPARHTNRPAKAKGYGLRAGLGVKREYISAGISRGNIEAIL